MWNISMCWLYAITKYRYVPSLEEIMAALDDGERLGFRYMELEGVGNQLHTVADHCSSIKRTCDEKGIEIVDFVPVLPDLMSVDESGRQKALRDFKAGCEVGSYFETSLTQVDTFHLPIHLEAPYDISKDFRYVYRAPTLTVDPKFDFWEYFDNVLVATIGACNDMAEEHGLKLCIEPRTWENVSNTWALELVMREVKSKNLGAVLDVAHLSAQKMNVVQCVEMLGNRTFYVHASDNDHLIEDHLEIGKGNVDWVSLLKALKKHEFKGYIGIDIGGKPELKPHLDSMYTNSKIYLEKMMKNLK